MHRALHKGYGCISVHKLLSFGKSKRVIGWDVVASRFSQTVKL
uniref:Uncharacterized protein n=1 Tax=uncultured gamma proteobacterium HF0010_01E20 TaxID=710977 RepID=E0XQ99_9GAMM|nr:hypothetical protein [uncultured gamma proteobacterium HF0010_01E20]